MISESAFAHVEQASLGTIYRMRLDYLADTSEKKINLGIGAYRDNNGKPWVLPVVRSIEGEIANDTALGHEYLMPIGLPAFCKAATELCLGPDSVSIGENRAGSVQGLGGTGALRIAAVLLKKFYGPHISDPVVSFSNPTWTNHESLFTWCGFTDFRNYRYWDAKNRCLDLKGMLEDLSQLPERSIVVLHACGHNPTGVDPTQDQWREIARVCKERNHFPVFDSAYQGFVSGDPDLDAWSIRMFEKAGFELFVSQSFSKNFGLYDGRIGNLIMVMKDPESLKRAISQLSLIIRGIYTNPPSHGARIVARALSDPSYHRQWRNDLRTMSERVKLMRKKLYEKLKELGTPGTWEHIVNQVGMYSYTGLTPAQCEFLIKQKHIHLLKSGRVNISALTEANVDFVAQSLHDAVVSVNENK